MEWSGDVLAEAIRLAGATLMATAVGLSMLGERRPAPLAVAVTGALVLAAGCLALIIATVAPFAQRLDEPVIPLALEYLQDSEHGPRILAPLLPAAVALVLWQGLADATRPMPRRLIHGMLAAVLAFIPVVMAAGGHAAGTTRENFAAVAHMVHMACALAWVALALSLAPRLLRGEPLEAILRPLGNVAAGLVMVLISSGVFVAWVYGAPPPWPAEEAYGQLLWLKTAVLATALAAAGLNRLVVLRAAQVSETRLRRALGIEVILLLTALVLAAWLSRTPPPA